MAEYKLLMPKLGESVIEATILSWNKKVGDVVKEHDIILEIATDKVDSDVPSPVNGVIKQLLHDVNVAVGVGEPLAIIEIEGDASIEVITNKKNIVTPTPETQVAENQTVITNNTEVSNNTVTPTPTIQEVKQVFPENSSVDKNETNIVLPNLPTNKYYSPLVLSIAQAENITMQELENIQGNGMENRVTKDDILAYIEKKKKGELPAIKETPKQTTVPENKPVTTTPDIKIQTNNVPNPNIEIIEMDRMRKMIAQHMVHSKNVAAHVSSFVECDVTNIVRWREKNKTAFQKREGFGLSFMPIFVEAIAKAIKDFPMINVSVEGDKIIKKKAINIGIATALPTGNLIVPVIKNTDQLNLLGIAKVMNEIVIKARNNNLQPDDVMDGTYTISNIGTFGNIIGTPIINQPQVAIMAVGAITKKPVVIEVDGQDVIAIRNMMYLSHTYDHRVVDGQLGGLFVKKVADYLEKFDLYQEI